MNFTNGRAKRLDDIDLPKIGAMIGVGEDELHAVIDVESRGTGFDRRNRPIILFERHWFYRLLPKAKRAEAVGQKLAVRRWSRATYNQDQYKSLERAMKIDEKAALESCSWGLFQIMGFNHQAAGYSNVWEMVEAFKHDEEAHLKAAVNFIKTNKLDDDLRRHDWAGFAKGYNGSGYKANRYDTKLANAYAKWKRIKDTPYNPKTKELVDKLSRPKSTTKRTSILTGITSTLLAAKPIKDAVDQAKDLVDAVMGAGPWVLLLMISVGGAIYIWSQRDKYAKLAAFTRGSSDKATLNPSPEVDSAE